MSRKNNLKSVRLSDEVLEYVQNFEGDGFNQKFENLVLFCMKEEKSKRLLIQSLDKEINEQHEILDKLSRLQRESDRAAQLLRNANYAVEEYARYIKGIGTAL